MSELFGARYATYEAGELRKSEFFVLPIFPHQHPFYHISTAITIQMLCGGGISINTPIIIAILWLFMV